MAVLLFLWILKEIFTSDLKQQCLEFLCLSANKCGQPSSTHASAGGTQRRAQNCDTAAGAFRIIVTTTLLTLNAEYLNCECSIYLQNLY